VAVVLALGLLMGKGPLEMLDLLSMIQREPSGIGAPAERTPADDEAAAFVAGILGETEDGWSRATSKKR
jgi:predicted metalloprotease